MNDDALIKIENDLNKMTLNMESNSGFILEIQVQIVKLIREPTLVLSVTDTILHKLSTNLQNVDDESERAWLKNQTSLTIQNFIFVMHAYLVYETEKNKEKGKKLLSDAVSMLGESIGKTLEYEIKKTSPSSILSKTIEIVASTSTGMYGKAIEVGAIFSMKLFEAMTDGGDQSFLSKIIDCFGNNVGDKKKNFFIMVEKAMFKIGRNKHLIGKNILLSEMLYNYADLIEEHKLEIQSEKRNSRIMKALLGVYLLAFPFLILFVLFAIALAVFFAYSYFWGSMEVFKSSLLYIGGVFVALPATYVIFIVLSVMYMSIRNFNKARRIKNVSKHIREIALELTPGA